MCKFKTKACHNCGYTIIQQSDICSGRPDKKDPNLLLEKCPFCNAPFYFEEEIKDLFDCQTILDKKVYAKYIYGNPEKERLYQSRIQKELEEIHKQLYKQKLQKQNREETQTQEVANLPKCPICGSTDLKKLTALDRGVSTFMWGLGSNKIGKTYECRKCKATF